LLRRCAPRNDTGCLDLRFGRLCNRIDGTESVFQPRRDKPESNMANARTVGDLVAEFPPCHPFNQRTA